jgi:hypothetical protein
LGSNSCKFFSLFLNMFHLLVTCRFCSTSRSGSYLNTWCTMTSFWRWHNAKGDIILTITDGIPPFSRRKYLIFSSTLINIIAASVYPDLSLHAIL